MNMPIGKVIKEWIDGKGNKRRTILWEYKMEYILCEDKGISRIIGKRKRNIKKEKS